MARKCDNTSSGVWIESDDGNVVMIKRGNYPQAFAFPAGHLDGDSAEVNIQKESGEEVGLTLVSFQKIFQQDIDNPCKNDGGDHHEWYVFESRDYSGTLKAGDDAKEAFWAAQEQLKRYAERTEYLMKKYNLPYTEVGKLTRAIFGNPGSPNPITDPEWKQEMGLEPVWYFMLKKLGKI